MPTVRLRGCDIAYDVSPDPEVPGATPLIWGHGLTSSRGAEDIWPLVDPVVLSADRSVVRYDARGHGASGPLRSPAEGDWSELAADLIALVDHLGFDRVVLGGASMGTGTALHATLRLGDRVDKLLLVIPPTGWESRAAQVHLYEQMAVDVETNGVEGLVAMAALTPPPDPFSSDDRWLHRRVETLRGTPSGRLAAAFRGAAVADLPDPARIATITADTLVLAWTGDPGHPVSTAERLGELLPKVEVHLASTPADVATWTSRCAAFLASA